MRAVAVGDNCLDVYVDLGQFTVGGNALNVALQWLRLGLPARYQSVVGNDEAAPAVLRMVRESGLDERHVEQLPGLTGVTLIRLHNGNREFLYEEFGVCADWTPGRAIVRELAAYDWVHLAGPYVREDNLEVLRAHGARISVDLSTDHHSRTLAGVEVAFASWTELLPYTAERLASKLLDAGARTAVITCGAAGSYAYTGAISAQAEAERIVPLDTTGAGDSFLASFVHDYAHGVSLDVALKRATVQASRTCLHLGGVEQQPQPVTPWLRETYYPLAKSRPGT